MIYICSDSLAALKALQAAKTTSPLVRQCQKTLNSISTRRTAGLNWVPEHAGYQEIKYTDMLARDGSIQKFIEPELSFGVSRQNIKSKIK
jgi:ribonuclease HI